MFSTKMWWIDAWIEAQKATHQAPGMVHVENRKRAFLEINSKFREQFKPSEDAFYGKFIRLGGKRQ